MTTQSTAMAKGSRFVRRTNLAPHEYRKNFHQVDAEVIAAVTSQEADQVTPLMSKIYLRLVSAPTEYWEGPGTLYFTAKTTEGTQVKASKVLYDVLGVASATAHKALSWMHEQGIIGYSSGKNGVGIRIFLNRAATSIGLKDDRAGKKILPFARGSNGEGGGSADEPAFKDSFAVQREYSDTDLNPHAPKDGADDTKVDKKLSNPEPPPTNPPQLSTAQSSGESDASAVGFSSGAVSVDEIVMRLQSVLEPVLKTVAVQTARREHERTREWLDKHGIPKATRVAQREAYNVLRSHGVITAAADSRWRADSQVGRASEVYTPQEAHRLSEREIIETAETCVALLEAQGKAIESTLSEIGSEAGGWLLPEDAPKVRDTALRLMAERSEGK